MRTILCITMLLIIDTIYTADAMSAGVVFMAAMVYMAINIVLSDKDGSTNHWVWNVKAIALMVGLITAFVLISPILGFVPMIAAEVNEVVKDFKARFGVAAVKGR